jgi:hypothetical protein
MAPRYRGVEEDQTEASGEAKGKVRQAARPNGKVEMMG